jgi:hypothetical protein
VFLKMVSIEKGRAVWSSHTRQPSFAPCMRASGFFFESSTWSTCRKVERSNERRTSKGARRVASRDICDTLFARRRNKCPIPCKVALSP